MEVTPIPKTKRIHLTGKPLRKLAAEIYMRDKGRCIYCGRHVEVGAKFHHEPCGARKSDEINKGVLLCMQCHYERHNGLKAGQVRKFCREYLENMYGGDSDED